jgi:hypothetical protein
VLWLLHFPAVRRSLRQIRPRRLGLCVGRDSDEPVKVPGEPPWAFTDGILHRVAVDVREAPYLNLAREAARMRSAE